MEWQAEDMTDQGVVLDVLPWPIIKTEDKPYHTDAEPNAAQGLTLVTETDEDIKTEWLLEEEFLDETNDSEPTCQYGVLPPPDDQQISADLSVKKSETGQVSTRSDSAEGIRKDRVAYLARRWKCVLCLRPYKTKEGLTQHLHSHENDRKRKYACDLCDRTFYTPNVLCCHTKVHALGMHQCQVCGERFTRKRNLAIHVRKLHLDKGQSNTPAPQTADNNAAETTKTELISDEEFIDERNDRDSVFQAGGSQQPAEGVTAEELPKASQQPVLRAPDVPGASFVIAEDSVKCSVCHDSFPVKLIEEHMRIMHCCPFCPQEFLRKLDLNKHIKTHRKNKGDARDAVTDAEGSQKSTQGVTAVGLPKESQLPVLPATDVPGASFVIVEDSLNCETYLISDEEFIDEGSGRGAVTDAEGSQQSTQGVTAEELPKASQQPVLPAPDVPGASFVIYIAIAEDSVKCSVCHDSFPVKLIEEHMRITHWCPFCPQEFLRKLELNKHIITHRKDKGGARDAVTDAEGSQQSTQGVTAVGLPKESQLPVLPATDVPGASFVIAEDSEIVSCDVCHNSYPVEQIETHMRIKHRHKTYKCPFCPQDYLAKFNLNKHISTHHKKRNACNSRDSASSTLWKVHNQEALYCKVCGRRYTQKESLEVHMFYRHPSNETQLLNDAAERSETYLISDEEFIDEGNDRDAVTDAEGSQQSAQGVKAVGLPKESQLPVLPATDVPGASFVIVEDSLNCETYLISDEEFIDEGSGRGAVPHTKRSQQTALVADDDQCVRVVIAEGSVTCEVCHKSYPEEVLETHLRLTHSDETFKCQFCPRVFLHESDFSKHVSIHDEDHARHYTCEKCGFKFPSEGSLERHMTTQHSRSEYNCQICVRTFYTMEKLQRHQKIHSAKPVSCEVCGARYVKEGTLKKHMVLKHTAKKVAVPSEPSNSSNSVHTKEEFKSEEELLDEEMH